MKKYIAPSIECGKYPWIMQSYTPSDSFGENTQNNPNNPTPVTPVF